MSQARSGQPHSRPVPAFRVLPIARALRRPAGAWRALLALLCFCLAGFSPTSAHAYGTPTFPCPPQLAPRVGFWVRIFTEYSEHQRVIHDARYPWIIYEVLDVGNLDQRQITALIDRRKEHYARLLSHLATTPPQKYSDEDRRVAGLLAGVPEMARFTLAEERVRSQPGIREQFRIGLERSGRYLHAMEAIFDSLGVPAEILCLPHVESSFYPAARSKAGAKGLWQFTNRTGRLFLRIERDIDERLDPLHSTVAAGRFLLHSYDQLQSWPLAVMSYNHGLAGMVRAKAEVGSADVARILLDYDGPAYGFASQNFYCEFLAALEVSRATERYFGPIEPDPPLALEDFRLPDAVRLPVLARAFGLPADDLARCNPALGHSILRGSRLIPRGYILHLPAGARSNWWARYASIPSGERFTKDPAPEGYKVRPGDTLSGIARNHRIPVETLRKLNGLNEEARIFPGQVLVFPDQAQSRL